MKRDRQRILFDLGVVLVELNYSDALARLFRRCDPARVASARAIFGLMERDPVVARYEVGHAGVGDVYDRLVELTGFRGDEREFESIWNGVFAENAPMIEFGHRVAREHDTYIVTNAGALHVPYLFERFPSLCFFKDWAASCYLHAAKPEAAFFERALAKFGVEPGACLLIDDRPENVEGARAFGLEAILYTGAAETIRAVEKALAEGLCGERDGPAMGKEKSGLAASGKT